ncbi:MAG: aminotransferase class I/II-fold pyridoxal phosphate-dependent enzyme [Acidobacteria bacterium]|nr:aminotransferase class I/II-fold pyridoxal phosphate-dependent enzyme [Acidobacteriota bacterium]
MTTDDTPSTLREVLKKIVSDKADRFTESVIREMTRQANLYGAVNLSQGFPDFAAPMEIKQAACDAILADINQYAITWGAKNFRNAIAEKSAWYLGLEVDPERHLTVTCGSTEAMIAALMAITNPGDEVVVFEPFYENYGPDAILSGATPRYVTLRAPDWSFDEDELAAAFNNHTKAIIINTPNNPTGKVFTRTEMEFIARLCQKWNVIAITDEIYEHILFNGKEHIAMATLDGMKDQTITINGLSKTYSVTGWRVGYTIAREDITSAIRKVHDFLTVGAAAPLQEAGAAALRLPQTYYEKLQATYTAKRERLLTVLKATGFECYDPDGAYYVMTDIRAFGYDNDVEFAKFMVKEVGVAVVPGSSFYHDPTLGSHQVRFTFCKKDETLAKAEERLQKLTTLVK